MASERERNEAVRLYKDTNMTVDEIAARFNVSRQSVNDWCRKAGVPRRGRVGRATDSPEPLATWEVEVLRREMAELTALVRSEWDQHQRDIQALTASVRVLAGEVHAYSELVRQWILNLPPPPQA